MILAIDVGNTNIVMGFIEGDTIVDKYRLSTNSNETAEEYAIKLHSVLDLMHLGRLRWRAPYWLRWCRPWLAPSLRLWCWLPAKHRF